MTTELAKLTGTKQIEVLKSLTQQAAGWLVGLTARTLRDHPEVPRNPDGTYNAKELLASPLACGMPAANPDDVEKIFQVAEWLGVVSTCDHDGGSLVTAITLMDSLRERYGNAGLQLFAAVALDRWSSIASGWGREPTESELREKLDKEFRDPLERAQKARLHRLFQVTLVCEYCRKIRRGRQWIKGSAPVGFLEALSVCDNCMARPAPRMMKL